MSDSSESERTTIETFTPVVESTEVSPEIRWERQQKRWQRRSFAIAALLFALTLISTLVVGASFAASYALGQSPDIDGFFAMYGTVLTHPRFLLAGVPFSFTLLAILLAHELGHYFACRYYRISASYPYFIPAPTLIGTLGAFIRIRSPIYNRKALFDVGLVVAGASGRRLRQSARAADPAGPAAPSRAAERTAPPSGGTCGVGRIVRDGA